MKKLSLIFSLVALLLLGLTSCSGGDGSAESLEQSIRAAEDAIAAGDTRAALSVADKVFDDTTLTPTQMGRLSMVYMQLADSLDQVTNTDIATDLYDKAYKRNGDSARIFYQNIEPERMQYVEAMAARLAHRNNPVDMSTIPNEEEADADQLFE